MLTTVTLQPVGDNELSPHIEAAFRAASNLDNYSQAQLADVTDWIAYLGEGSDLQELNALDASTVTDLEFDFVQSRTVRVSSSDAITSELAGAMAALPSVDYVIPVVQRDYIHDTNVPNDTLVAEQWHLFNYGQVPGGNPGEDANVFPVLDRYTGEGVTIAIVDGGLQGDHPDLAPNYRADLGVDYIDDDGDPFPTGADDNHGTAVGGVAAAAGLNSQGVTGAAPDAELASIRIIGGFADDEDFRNAFAHRIDEIDISNNSWGPSQVNSRFPESPISMMGIEEGIMFGRDGLGVVYLFSAGNDGDLGVFEPDGSFTNANADANLRQPHNSIRTLNIGAVDHTGRRASYSTTGTPLIAVAPSADGNSIAGIVTADRTGEDGYNRTGTFEDLPDPLADVDYTSTFSGTSSSTPLVSGVVALMLEANPNLSYRDVQHIITRTARMTDSLNTGWSVNGAGFHVNNEYGFGVIDAEAAVNLAEVWTPVSAEEMLTTGLTNVNRNVPDGDTLATNVTISEDNAGFAIEHVQLVFNATAEASQTLRVTLTSPDGTESVLVKEHIAVRDGFITDIADYDNWTFTSTHHWGEDVAGEWTISVTDSVTGDAIASFDSYELIFTGTSQAIIEPEVPETLPGVISGFVYVDADEDGTKDANEQGLAGHPLFIDLDGNAFPDPDDPVTYTGGGGLYVFDDLAVGPTAEANVSYTIYSFCTIESQVVDRFTATPRTNVNFASFDGTTSNCLENVDTDITGSVTVDDTGAGVPNAVVFVDVDNDGLLSLGEPFAATDSNGDYSLSNFTPGTYTLRTSFPPGYPCVTGCDGWEIEIDLLGNVNGNTDFTTGFEFDGSGDPNSPNHGIVDGFHLGQFVSGDPTVDDNDGVFFLTGLNPGQMETIGITAAQPAVSPGYLNAWIDFNGDGVWSDSEQIFFDERLDDGFNSREIMVPANASATDAAARFRWTFERGVTPFEDAIAGETEDYLISVPMGPMSGLRAVDDVATLNEDTDVTIDVLANDEAGPLGESFVIESLGTPSHGTATVIDGEVLYTPTANFSGTDEFGYTIIDTSGTRSSAVVSVTVVAVNDPPTAVDDEVTVRVQSRFNPIDVLANDSDLDGDMLMITSASVDIGSVSVEGDQLLYTPPASLFTDDVASITYVVTDGLESSEATVTVNISADQLVAFDLELFDTQGNLITEITEDENFQLRVSVRDLRTLVDREGVFSAYLDVLFNSSLVTPTSTVDFTGSAYTEAQSGTIGSGIIDEAGAIASADPDPAPIGPDTQFLFAVDFVASDPGLATFTGNGADSPLHPVTLFGEDETLPEVLVQFNAGSLNIVPITKANDDVLVMNEDEANEVLRTIDVLDNDNFAPDVEPISIIAVSAVSPAEAGSVTIVGNQVRFDPTENFYGDASFTYTLRDTAGVESTATVSVTVNEVNDLPAPVDDEFSILRGGSSIVLDVLSNDIANNPDDETLETLSLVDFPPTMTDMGGTVVVNNGELLYSPPTAGMAAQDTFTYEVTDGRGGTATGNVTITFIEEVAQFDLSIVDRDDNPLSGPLGKGDEFYLVVTAEDLQSPAVGVFSAYIDLFYSANVVLDPTADVIFGDAYPEAQKTGDTSVSGLIDEIGAIGGVTQLGAGAFEVFRVPFVSLAAGDAVFTSDFADQPINAVTLVLGGEPVALAENNINFGTTSITVENPVGAQPDSADVIEDTVNNVIRVLDNDLGSVSISAVGEPDRGGTVTIDGDTVLYTPAPNFNGVETFTYTALDAAGNECLALVTVTVTDTNDAPVAADDMRGVPVNSTENLFDLLANDIDLDPGAGGELTITAVNGEASEATTAEGGTVTIGDGGAFVLYTPAPGFVGTDTFTYTVSDGLGETDTATVTINVNDTVDRPIVNYSFEFIGMDGQPVDNVEVGDTFLMNIFVEDVREISLGVFAAYLDVTWTGGVAVDGDFDDLQFNEELFPNQQRGMVNNGINEIDELGATYGDIVPPPELCPDPSTCQQLLVTVPLVANGPGLVQFTGNPAEGPAPGSPLHHTLVLERGSEVPNSQIDFATGTVSVAGTSLTRTNYNNPFDVDANGAVSPIDALLVINELNTLNGVNLLRAADGPMTDVNADGYVSPLDALLVINQLGSASQANAVMAGDDAGEAPQDLAASSSQAVLRAIDSIFVDEEESSSDNDLDTVMELIARDAQRDQ